MGIASAVIIISLLLGSALCIGLGTLIYYLIYRHVINKRLEKGITHKKGLMSPVWMPAILVGVQVIFGNPLLVVILLANLTVMDILRTEEVTVHESMEIGCYTAQEMQEGHMSIYSIEENEGYAKQQSDGDGIRFTCFSAEELGQSWQPHYLVYMEVLEEYPEDAVYTIEGTLLEDGEVIEGFSWYTYEEDLPVCVISAMQEDTPMEEFSYELQISCTVLESEDPDSKRFGDFSETFVLSAAESE